MPVRHGRLMPVLASALLLVGAANIGAYAATGGPLILGKGNTASKTTTLKTTGNGAALKLKSKPGKAPLKVSNNTKVKKLNADLVDGLDSSALQSKSYVYNLTAPLTTEDFAVFQLPGLPAGRYLASINASMDITGGPVAFSGCFLVTGSGPAIQAPVVALGNNGGGELFIASGSGYVDTTISSYRITCQRSGGDDMTIPALPNFPSTIVFTRVDDVTTGSSTGAGSALPRDQVIR
jgi:hypothetical protein